MSVSNYIIRLARRVYVSHLKKNRLKKFKHGQHFYSNSHIDSLIPQFVEIGDNFVSAPGSVITAHDASTFLHCRKYRIEKVKIGNNVFLGANSVVLPGVTIGDNVIIGAGSIVNKNIPSDCVYAGNPAKYICKTVEYINKCKLKNVLYEAPNSIIKSYEVGERYSESLKNEFQSYVIMQYNKRAVNEKKT